MKFIAATVFLTTLVSFYKFISMKNVYHSKQIIFQLMQAFVNTNPVKNFSDVEDQWKKECAAETKLSELKGNNRFELIRSQTAKCYFKCFLSKSGVFTSNGFSSSAEIIPESKREEIQKTITNCIGPRRENVDDCSWGFRGFACILPDILWMVLLL